MARFRLRFLLQEFDLNGPEVVIGRSPDCQVTIEDPLVSRHHARIRIQGDDVVVADLGSRNGVRVNGRPIDAETALQDGDRIRLGTQDLIFSVVQPTTRQVRATGFMTVCRKCGTPFPEGSPACPHCGASSSVDDDTMSGLRVEPRKSWTFQLLGEVIERALATGRGPEADRVMRRVSKEIDDYMVEGERLEPAHVAMISIYAVRLAKLLGSAEWVAWAFDLHRRHEFMPATSVLDRLIELDPRAVRGLEPAIGSFVQSWRERSDAPSNADLVALTRLEQFGR